LADAESAEVVFHARVRGRGEIVIPHGERAAAGIREGDLVSVRLRRVAGAPEGHA
jgi:bifunctional DNA-binding transcriptional regulator/antitoxin component of YhaV-PrlF toxin-antitoxin module